MSDIERLLDALGDVRIKFWSCPNEHPKEPLRVTVKWDGDVATCTDCGMTNLTDPRLQERPTCYVGSCQWIGQCGDVCLARPIGEDS